MFPTHADPVPALPEIFLTPDEHARLSRLIGDAWAPEGVAGLLQQELDRATVCDPAERPGHAVGLDRWIHYTDGRTATSRRVRIVMPQDADVDAGRISALSHVGCGLIGLLEGQSILWPDPSGATRKLTPILIEDPDDLV
jgi:regulator of nucleoside diphosphate kinase